MLTTRERITNNAQNCMVVEERFKVLNGWAFNDERVVATFEVHNETVNIFLDAGYRIQPNVVAVYANEGPVVGHTASLCAQRALAALRALRRRCSGVMLSARRLPPILPPSRPSSDRIWDLRDLAGCAGSADSGSTDGRSPSNLCTAMKPAWTSSSGSLPDGSRIRYQLGMFGRMASSLLEIKVAHYRVSRSRIGGRLRCPAGSRGKSVARRPSPRTDPSKKASSAEDDRRNGPRISETPGEGDGRSTLRKRTGRCASLIVEKRGRGAPAQFSAARSSNRFPLKFPPRHWIERVCWPPQSTLPDTSDVGTIASDDPRVAVLRPVRVGTYANRRRAPIAGGQYKSAPIPVVHRPKMGDHPRIPLGRHGDLKSGANCPHPTRVPLVVEVIVAGACLAGSKDPGISDRRPICIRAHRNGLGIAIVAGRGARDKEAECRAPHPLKLRNGEIGLVRFPESDSHVRCGVRKILEHVHDRIGTDCL